VVLVLLVIKLVGECNARHAILDAQDVVIRRVHSVQAFSGIGLWILNGQFRIVDSREIKCSAWLGPVHGETEWPREQWECIEGRWSQSGGVHFVNNVVVESVRHVFEKCETVDVQRSASEAVIIRPTGTGHIRSGQVERLNWVIEIRKIDGCVGLGSWLVLNLGDEHFVFLGSEMFSFRCVQVSIHTVNLWHCT